MTILTSCPPIPIKFSKDLFSMPTFGYNSEYLRQVGDFLERKILSDKFRKFPNTIGKLIVKHLKFIELYERAKTLEEQNKKKTCRKTEWLGYGPRLVNKNDQRVFERLSERAATSLNDRRSN